MNKEIINIDGKTYVRQDSPTIDPDEIAKAKALVSAVKKNALIMTIKLLPLIFIVVGIFFGELSVAIGSCIVCFFPCYIITVLVMHSKNKSAVPDEVWEAMSTNKDHNKEAWKHDYNDPSKYYLPGNFYH